jgi:hypothetical protein
MPAVARRYLLSQRAKARAQLFYHGDFDWPGARIRNHVGSRGFVLDGGKMARHSE